MRQQARELDIPDTTVAAAGYHEMTTEPSPITLLLHRARDGDLAARDKLMNIVYTELHRLAKNELRRDWSCRTLQPTALVNEAFLKLFGAATPAFHDRSHFLGIMAHVMRQVLVDHARARRAQKRGSGLQVPLEQAVGAPPAGYRRPPGRE